MKVPAFLCRWSFLYVVTNRHGAEGKHGYNGEISVHIEKPIDQLIAEIMGLNREICILELKQFSGLTLDFTDEFLRLQDTDHLRHILLAACLQARKGSRLAS